MNCLVACRRVGIVGLAVGLCLVLSGAGAVRGLNSDEPIWRGNTLHYPEGANIPRSLTRTERAYLQRHPLRAEVSRGGTVPTGPIHCVAEYEPMEAIMLAWESFSTLQREMVGYITTTGDADVVIVVDSTSEQNSVTSTLTGDGVNMSRVQFFVRGTDTVWIRDYGPRYIYEGGCRAIVDHTYNRPRPNDNTLNSAYGPSRNQPVYLIPLVHGGGNFHLNALNEGNASELILNENSGLTEAQVWGYWNQYQNLDTTIWDPFPTYVDSTQHIDMWMQVVDDDVIIISDWPANPGSTQDVICDNTAADFAARGWDVHRVPARSISGTHYTYTNMVMCNDLILLPSYTHSTMVPYNSQAVATLQAACPTKTVVPLNCQSIIPSAGAMHCIVQHIPEPFGGAFPTTYLRNYRGGETLNPDDLIEIEWLSDDDRGVTSVDLLLSTDGGANFDTVIASGLTDDGSEMWTVPDVATTQARIRVVVRDLLGNTGTDESDSDIIINGTINCPEDLVTPAGVEQQDLNAVLNRWGDADCLPGGAAFPCPEDLVAPDGVEQQDLNAVLNRWGDPDCV